MKNPALIIARQAYTLNGPQQVKNGSVPRAGKNMIVPNELLETEHGKRLDTGAALAPEAITELVALEASKGA